ncbi:hypothetical protein WIS52_01520 [Pseudonocardia nematodicida]|uniref:Uncharacterized protein n=1 Tax=Pseudonocardia nematodicida TaxID=1206997 RepID=A0ABV1K3W5_9PSEU
MAHADDAAHDRRPGERPQTPQGTPSAAVLTPPTGLPAATPAAPTVPQQRGPAEPATPPAPPAVDPSVRTCTCGHPEEMHEHYRPGSDCGACGASACASFQPLGSASGSGGSTNALRRLLRRRRH